MRNVSVIGIGKTKFGKFPKKSEGSCIKKLERWQSRMLANVTPREIDLEGVYDYFSITQIISTEDFGLYDLGQSYFTK